MQKIELIEVLNSYTLETEIHIKRALEGGGWETMPKEHWDKLEAAKEAQSL